MRTLALIAILILAATPSLAQSSQWVLMAVDGQYQWIRIGNGITLRHDVSGDWLDADTSVLEAQVAALQSQSSQ